MRRAPRAALTLAGHRTLGARLGAARAALQEIQRARRPRDPVGRAAARAESAFDKLRCALDDEVFRLPEAEALAVSELAAIYYGARRGAP